MTLELFSRGIDTIPASTSWYLSDLGEAKGKQQLYILQSPQRLKTLKEHALVESAVSSNRIEGVVAETSRIATVVFGKGPFRDRDEEEIRGYREALTLIHENAAGLPVAESTMLNVHRLIRGTIWDAGAYKEKDSDIIERYPDGRSRVRFQTVRAVDTPAAMRRLVDLYRACIEERHVHPLLTTAAFNLDFLCIHPFRDGNGRVSRLLLLLQLYHAGFEAGRYISLERLIEQNKERYYETLEASSKGWHETANDPWPYINYCLYIVKTAYEEFEERMQESRSERGEKMSLVLRAVQNAPETFAAAEIQAACPDVSLETIRRTLKNLRKTGGVECLGLGQQARWRRIDKRI